MGQRRDWEIMEWQENAGLRLPPQADVVLKMQQCVIELLKALVLEASGIRDGDSHWTACDPIHDAVYELQQLERERCASWETLDNRAHPDRLS